MLRQQIEVADIRNCPLANHVQKVAFMKELLFIHIFYFCC